MTQKDRLTLNMSLFDMDICVHVSFLKLADGMYVHLIYNCDL
jgi:hypothetical protein